MSATHPPIKSNDLRGIRDATPAVVICNCQSPQPPPALSIKTHTHTLQKELFPQDELFVQVNGKG